MTDLSNLVKPLVWGKDTDPDSDTFGCIEANPPQGFRYYIKHVYGGMWRLSGSVPFGQPDYPTLEAAKAAAQADYTARILAALNPDAVAKIREDALREAADRTLGLATGHECRKAILAMIPKGGTS